MKRILVLVLVCFSVCFAQAQDSDFVRAKKTVSQIENGLLYLKTGDVATFNSLAAKLTQARELLEATTYKSDAEYAPLVKRWNNAKQNMIDVSNAWKNPQKPKVTTVVKPIETAKPRPSNTSASATSASKVDLTKTKVKIEIALSKADFINKAKEKDINKISSIGGNHMYEPNQTVLQDGIDAIAVLASVENNFELPAQKQKIETAQAKLERMRVAYVEQKKKRAASPKKAKKKSSSQKLWLKGSMFYEITKTGQVWIRSKRVGDIENNGKIWVHSSQKGSIEKNGDVWHSGRKVGSITDKGEVWKGGRKVGLIEKNGKVWIGGSAKGEITGTVDRRKAAILYYFNFF